MDLNFHINDFDGPLDLLLHLVKESKMDIYEIETSKIIDEYLEFIRKMEDLNIDVASVYLVMACELVHLKSKLLVNKKDEESIEDEFNINSEEDLKRRLIEYQNYKELTSVFKELEEKRNEIHTKYPENYRDFLDNDEIIQSEMTKDDLYDAMLSFLERLKREKPLNTKITKKELSVDERIIEIRNFIKNKKRIYFIDLFDSYNKDYLIVSFLSILEMSKNKEIEIKQEHNFEEIILEAM